MYACDYRWWKYHISDVLRDFEGKLWTQTVQWEDKGKPVDPAQWGITGLTSMDRDGLSKEPGVIHTGGNSGLQALNLAGHLLGWDGRVILIGFDMMMTEGKRHWFGDHPADMNAASSYPSFIQAFRTIDPVAYGLQVWNCSRRTALDCFPKYSLEDVLNNC